jgi:hypothetical protein
LGLSDVFAQKEKTMPRVGTSSGAFVLVYHRHFVPGESFGKLGAKNENLPGVPSIQGNVSYERILRAGVRARTTAGSPEKIKSVPNHGSAFSE